jgi:nicotinate-nucleotide pyrophosphorylase
LQQRSPEECGELNVRPVDVINGDITTRATISKTKKAFGKFLVKADCNIAGLEIAKMVLEMEFGLGVVMDMVIVIMPI